MEAWRTYRALNPILQDILLLFGVAGFAWLNGPTRSRRAWFGIALLLLGWH